ncbi:MAG: endonuclease/exonuclease/phosphatase family protein [Candidatus Thorarchaeota archaeon]
MTLTKKHRLLTVCFLSIFVMTLGFVPGMVQAYDNPDHSIPEIQGDGFVSPFKNQYVDTWGVVTAVYQGYYEKSGFFVQDVAGDDNPDTSDGIFVWNFWSDVSVGDEVWLSGKVVEYYGLTELSGPSVTVLSWDNPLPDPVELDPPRDDYASDVYYEALEGMLVTVACMRAIAGTNQYGEAAGVVADSHMKRVFQDDPVGTGNIIFTDDAGGYEVVARTGNYIKDLVGPLDYTYDEYKVLPSPDAPPEVIPEWWAESDWVWPLGLRFGLTVATYNMYNLFDEFDDPDKHDPPPPLWEVELQLTKHALAIHDLLRMPDLIAVQEVENIEILERLANTPPIDGVYGVVLIEGPYYRAVDVALLYKLDRVEVVSAEARQTCTDLDDGYGPGTDPNFPCPEGYNPLFSRPPLVVHLRTKAKCSWWNRWHRHRSGTDLWLIINHFKSKSVYGPTYADTEPRRIQQAEWVGALVDEIQDSHRRAKVIVIGDLNSFTNEAPLKVLKTGGLKNLVLRVPKYSRYTYIYRGVSEVLDHILITPSLRGSFLRSRIVHFNVDFPESLWSGDSTTGVRSSDHEVLMASFWLP